MARSPDIPRQTNVFDMIGGMRAPVTETDDGWIKVGDTTDEISPPFQNSWGHDDPDKPVSFFLDRNGIVRFRGKATGGTSGTVVLTLPEGFRPEFEQEFVASGTTGPQKIVVDSDGTLTISDY